MFQVKDMNTLLSFITKQCGLLVDWKFLHKEMMFGNGNLVSLFDTVSYIS